MSKRTPGPWSADLKIDCGAPHSEIVGADGEIVAALWPPSLRDQANARLIAAAPELLAFAQEFLSDYQSEDGMTSMKHYARKAHEAIAKATGGDQ